MSVTVESLQQLKEQLNSIQDLGLPIKQNMYTHLTELVSRIVLNNQSDGFENFEEISALIKRHSVSVKDPNKDSDVNAAANEISGRDALNLLSRLSGLVRQSQKSKENFYETSQMLEWAGVSFGEEQSMLINQSL